MHSGFATRDLLQVIPNILLSEYISPAIVLKEDFQVSLCLETSHMESMLPGCCSPWGHEELDPTW